MCFNVVQCQWILHHGIYIYVKQKSTIWVISGTKRQTDGPAHTS